MYEDFVATDRWTGEPQHCVWKGTVVAIEIRSWNIPRDLNAFAGQPTT